MRLLITRMSTVLLGVFLFCGAAAAQFNLSGTVTDQGGEALIGVSVLLKGTATGAVSDADGRFSLRMPTNSGTITVSYVGYETQDLAVNSANPTITVKLNDGNNRLNEVVVTGLATNVKRANAANAVASVDSKDLVGVTVQSTLDGALYGKFTGVNISANSGAPGGGISMKLRGVTTINGSSQPLFIIDGVYMDNSAIPSGTNLISKAASQGSKVSQDNPSNRVADIDPEDIERIEVLKGASAAAIYGSRAGAGVIIITTKRGKSGTPTVNVSQSVGFSSMLRRLGTRQWDDAKVTAAFGAGKLDAYHAAVAAGKVYDYEDEFYGNTAMSYTSRVNISGGNDDTRYFVGYTYKNDEGIVDNTGYKKNTLRFNLNQKVFSFMDLDLSSFYVRSAADRGFFNNDNTSTTMGVSFASTPSWMDLHPDSRGNYPDNGFAPSNFLQTAALITNREEVNRFIGGATLTTRLFTSDNASLKLIARSGFDSYGLGTTAIFPKELQFQKNGNGTDGAAIIGSTRLFNNNLAAFLVHTLNTGNNVELRTQLGMTAENFDRNNVTNYATFLIGSQTNIDQASSLQAEQTKVVQHDRGFFLQEEINYQDLVITTIGMRADKSTNNGAANKLYYYPKASVAFNAHKLGNLSANFSQLKLRLAYGQSGNFAPSGAIYTSLDPANIGGVTGSLISASQGNANLGPEQQTELEVGFDVGVLRDRLMLDFTAYNKNIIDFILPAQVPSSSGFGSKWVNGGDIQNRGIEIGLTAIPVQGALTWMSRTSFWLNRALVTRLEIPAYNTGAFGATLGTYRIEEGFSPTQIVGISPTPGDNGLQVFGNGEPDFQMSFQNGVQYKNFEFNAVIHVKQGGDNVNLSSLLTDIFGTSPDFDATNLDPTGALTNGNYRLSQLGSSAQAWVEDASYMRLREVGLYYSIPKKAVGGLADLKIGISGRNLINVFSYSSYDPEVSNFGSNAISSSVEVLPFPSAKSVYFRIGATF